MAQFDRSLGLLDAVMLVAGSMIGSGIFIVSAGMLRGLGSPAWMLVAWVVAGVLTVLAALSYGELAGMMPHAGGQYVYIQRAFGKLPSFLYGWTMFLVINSGIVAAVAVAFAKFSAVFFPVLSPDNILVHLFTIPGGKPTSVDISTAQVYAVATIILLSWFNTRGVRHAKTLTTVFTMAKVVAVLALIAIGLTVGLGSGQLTANFSTGWHATSMAADGSVTPLAGIALLSALGVAMVGSLFSSDGWNSVTFIAGEIKRPQRNIPLSLALGTLIVTVLYVLANITYLALLPNDGIQHALADRVGTAAAKVIMGDKAVWVMAALIMVSTFGCINGYVLVGPRLCYAMAKDGLFFKQASVLSGKGVPSWALWLQCAWAGLLCFSGGYGALLNYTTFASLLFYVVTITGLFVLRKREPNAERPYRAFGYPVIPAVYILCALAFCVNLLIDEGTRRDTGIGLGIVAFGGVVYFLTGMHRSASSFSQARDARSDPLSNSGIKDRFAALANTRQADPRMTYLCGTKRSPQHMSLSITFHGAAGMVTGSKHLIELSDGRRVLLDCGMFQGEGRDSDAKNRRFGFDPRAIDALVLSHAHIDHSGLLPRLVAEGFRGPIYATAATRDLCTIMLEDSARIQESDFMYEEDRARKRGQTTEHDGPLYGVDDVRPTLELFQVVDYGEAFRILPDVELTFTDAGHILGSAAVHLAIDTPEGVRRITFSGDVGRYVDRLLPDPSTFPQSDVIICETTYGDRDHPPVHEMMQGFLEEVERTCVKQGGKLIIPAFSIGKTQEILYTLNHLYNEGRLPRIPVFVDSPLSISATAVYREHSKLLQEDVRAELLQDPDLFAFPGVEFVRKAERSKQLNQRREPCIIIAASGMMEAGRIKHHLFHNLAEERNTVLVVGFCAPGTLGADLLEGRPTVRIFGDDIPVRAAIVRMESYSAHADRTELLRFLACQDPAKVQRTFLVHGVHSSLHGFRDLLASKGYTNIAIPQQGETVGLAV